MNELRCSRDALWIANVHQITQNCSWQQSDRANVLSLQWNANAPDKPPGRGGDAIIGFLGRAITHGSSLAPNAGWQVCACHSFGRLKLMLLSSLWLGKVHYFDRNGALELSVPMLPAVYQLSAGKASGKGLILLSRVAANSLAEGQGPSGTVLLNRDLEVFVLGPLCFG